MQRGLRSLAHRDREAQERVALHHLLLRLLGLLGDVSEPGAVQRIRGRGAEHREAHGHFAAGPTEVGSDRVVQPTGARTASGKVDVGMPTVTGELHGRHPSAAAAVSTWSRREARCPRHRDERSGQIVPRKKNRSPHSGVTIHRPRNRFGRGEH